jgi:hypothetical protein
MMILGQLFASSWSMRVISLMQYIHSVLPSSFVSYVGIGDMQSEIKRINTMFYQNSGEGLNTWHDVRNSQFGSSLNAIVCSLVSYGIIGNVKGSVSQVILQDYKRQAFALQKESGSMIEYFLSNVVVLGEVLYEAVATQNLSVLMRGRSTFTECDTMYATIKAIHPIVMTQCFDRISEDYEIRDFADYVVYLKGFISIVERGISREKDPHYKKILRARYELAASYIAEVENVMGMQGFKKEPFVVCLVGHSSIGKSNIMEHVISHICQATGKPRAEGDVVVLNSASKYDDGITNSTRIIVLDDVGQSRKGVEGSDETYEGVMFRYINNVRTPSLQAEAEKKAKVNPAPDGVVLNTNVRGIHAGKLVYCSGAMKRRIDVLMDCRLKPEYKSDAGTLDVNKVEKDPGVIEDAYEIDMFRYVLDTTDPDPLKSVCKAELIEGCDKMSLNQSLTKIFCMAKAKYERQSKFVTKLTTRSRLRVCEHGTYMIQCPMCLQCGQCAYGDCPCGNIPCAIEKGQKCVAPEYPGQVRALVDELLQEQSDRKTQSTLKEIGRKLLSKVPVEAYANSEVVGGLASVRCLSFFLWSLFAATIASNQTFIMRSVITFFVRAVSYIPDVRDKLIELNFIDRDSFAKRSHLVRMWETQRIADKSLEDCRKENLFRISSSYWMAARVIGIITIAKVVYDLVKKYKMIMKKNSLSMPHVKEDSFLKPVPSEMERYRDSRIPPTWRQTFAFDKPATEVSRTTGFEALVSNVKAATVRLSILNEKSSKMIRTNATGVRGNFYMVPYHWLTCAGVEDTECFQVTFKQGNSKDVHPTLQTLVHRQDVFAWKEKDRALIYLKVGAPNKDLLKHFPETHKVSSFGKAVMRKNDDGELIVCDYMKGRSGSVVVEDEIMECDLYSTTCNIPDGCCGSSIISDGKDVFIAGFHTYKSGSDPRIGGAVCATRGEVEDAIAVLSARGFVAAPSPPLTAVLNSYAEVANVTLMDDPHPYHAINKLKGDVAVEFIGAHSGGGKHNRSKVKRFDVVESLQTISPVTLEHDAPEALGDYATWDTNMAKIAMHGAVYDPSVYMHAKEDLCIGQDAFIAENIGFIKEYVHPVELDVAINGCHGVPALKSLNMSTSAGFPIRKQKKKVFDVKQHGGELFDHVRVAHPGVERAYVEALERCKTGIRPGVIYECSFKDEPTKIGKKKVRVFTGESLAFSMLCKQYVSPLLRAVNTAGYLVLEHCVGINCHSSDWDELYNWLAEYGDNAMAGDYSDYDQSYGPDSIEIALIFLMDIARASGNYCEIDLTILQSLLSELLCPVIEYNGVLLRSNNWMISGNLLTVFLNNRNNSLNFRYGYYYGALRKGLRSIPLFSEMVRPNFTGDDAVATVKPECTWFDNIVMYTAMGSIGVKYTDENKEIPNYRFEPLMSHEAEGVTYLKRRFSKVDWTDDVVGPIEQSSYSKMLSAFVKTSGANEKEVLLGTLQAYLKEVIFHSESEFEITREKTLMMLKDLGLERLGELPTAHAIKKSYSHTMVKTVKFKRNSEAVDRHSEMEVQPDDGPVVSFSEPLGIHSGYTNMPYLQGTGVHTASHEIGSFLEREIQIGRFEWGLNALFTESFNPWQKWFEEPTIRRKLANYRLARCSLQMVIRVNGGPQYSGRLLVAYKALPSLGDEDQSFQITGAITDLNGGFMVATPGTGGDPSNIFAHMLHSQLPHVLINPSTSEPAVIEMPYAIPQPYFDIQVEDYRSVGPFSPGVVIMQSLVPLATGSSAAEPLDVSIFVKASNVELCVPTAATTPDLLVRATPTPAPTPATAPARMLRNAQHMRLRTPGVFTLMIRFVISRILELGAMIFVVVLCVGFFWVKPLFSVAAGMDEGEEDEHIVDPKVIRREEVSMPSGEPSTAPSGSHLPTDLVEGTTKSVRSSRTIPPTFITNAEETNVRDETGIHPVSYALDLGARTMSILRRVPVISRYASATEVVLTAGRDVARFLGFSRPRLMEPVHEYRPSAGGNITNVDTHDTCRTLGLYAKGDGLSIDPRIYGITDKDELHLASFCGRPGIISVMPWKVSDIAGTTLFGTSVGPVQYRQDTASGFFYQTPASYAVQLFQYWRCTVCFKIIVVTNAFQKGRLRIWTDPVLTDVDSASVNTTMNHIMDLSTQTEVTVKVGWMSARSLLTTRIMDANAPKTMFERDTFFKDYNPATDTAWFNIEVLNSLTYAGDASVDGTIIVYHWIEDPLFIEPTNAAIGGWSFAEVPAGATEVGTFRPNCEVIEMKRNSEIVINNDRTQAGHEMNVVSFGNTDMAPDNMAKLYGGEVVYSLRACMRRYTLANVFRVPDGTAGVTIPSFPIARGSVVTGLGNFIDGQTQHAGTMSIISFVSRCFAAYRGSMRHCFYISDMQLQSQISEDPLLMVSRVAQESNDNDILDNLSAGTAINPDIVPLIDSIPMGWSGFEITAASVNPVMKVEMPFYSNSLFRPCKLRVVNDTRMVVMWLDHDRDGRANRSSREIVHTIAAGEDLSFGVFAYVPPVTIFKLPGAT